MGHKDWKGDQVVGEPSQVNVHGFSVTFNESKSDHPDHPEQDMPQTPVLFKLYHPSLSHLTGSGEVPLDVHFLSP
jgi:hypothetical protein